MHASTPITPDAWATFHKHCARYRTYDVAVPITYEVQIADGPLTEQDVWYVVDDTVALPARVHWATAPDTTAAVLIFHAFRPEPVLVPAWTLFNVPPAGVPRVREPQPHSLLASA